VKSNKAPKVRLSALVLTLALWSVSAPAEESSVKIWQEPRVIPTYLIGKPDPNPRFYTGRTYQGAQGRVYPYPMLDLLTDNRRNKTYNPVYLENEYLKISVMPEIGGRLFSALDKTNNYDFVYHQHVIKPALIGMLGAWISGGIEWNFPHHHRPSVFMPIDYVLQENPDGSSTIWVGETEIRHRTKWMAGLTLYPGKSYIEATIRPFNRTPFVNTFLCFANVGIHASPEYQVIFPPSTEFATYHTKNQFAHWPICYEVFNRTDYTKGVDVSWWKNHPEWISMFAWNYEDDFFGGYDHGKQAGTVSVANHHVVPGRKFWEWSNGPRGWMWDKILTENDGPELELMTGAYSDNQPDYSWLQPYETKIIKMYWYPIRQMGGIKNANLKAAVNLDLTENNTAKIAFNTTSKYENAKALLKAGSDILFVKQIDISPDKPFADEVPLPTTVKEHDLRISLHCSKGEELISYTPVKRKNAPMPEPVKAPAEPKDIKTVEQLYLTGLRLEQFHNPALEPYPYYEEALRRDPNNYRVNVVLGILYFKRGLFEQAEKCFARAIERATYNYTSPRDGEAYYYHGLVQKFLGKYDHAYDDLYKATWSYAAHTAAYYHLAEIACIRDDFATALNHIDRALATNAWNTKAMDLKAAVLRHLGRHEESEQIASKVLDVDPLDFWAHNELYLAKSAAESADQADKQLNTMKKRMRDDVQSHLELAVDYGNSGLWDEAIEVLSRLDTSDGKKATSHPMPYYYLAFYSDKKAQTQKAQKYYNLAAKMPPDYCFPFRLESIEVLRTAFTKNPDDARAHYYLGNLFYDHQPENAVKEWEKSVAIDDTFATAHRNLGFAYARDLDDVTKAITSYEKAVACNPKDPRLYYELDLLYQRDGKMSPQKRLELLEKNNETVVKRDDAFSRKVLLYVQLGDYDKALELMMNRHFHTWEGGATVHGAYVDSHLLRGTNRSKAGQYRQALKDYQTALEYPENFQTTTPYRGGRESQVYHYIATAYEALGDSQKAKEFYEKSVDAKQRQTWSELRYYQALSFQKLGQNDKADEILDGLTDYATAEAGVDFFAKFGEKEPPKFTKANNNFLLGLALLAKGEKTHAKEKFAEALELNPNHLWAAVKLSQIDQAI
jgi:tetratricopeptide (TPR) repeat protein